MNGYKYFLEKHRASLQKASAEFMATFTPKQAKQQKLVEQAYNHYKNVKNRQFDSYKKRQETVCRFWLRYFRRAQEFERLRKENI